MNERDIPKSMSRKLSGSNVSRETRTAKKVPRETSKRAVHVALASTIEANGTRLTRAMMQAFQAFNAEHFEGKLGLPCVMLTSPASPRAFADYIGRDEHGIESRIRIRPTIAENQGETFMLDVLLHEMVHAWVAEVCAPNMTAEQLKTENTYKGHGPVFCEKCNAIGKTLNLAPVAVKGRGAPDCARWPLNAREGTPYADAPKPDKAPGGKSKAKPRDFKSAVLDLAKRLKLDVDTVRDELATIIAAIDEAQEQQGGNEA